MVISTPILRQLKKIPISEIFESIQGEGPLMGRYSLFIRFAGCNLAGICKSCDTDFSVKMLVDIEYIVDVIKRFRERGGSIIVFTGGEPGLYSKVLDEILDRVPDSDVVFQVETNGIIRLSDKFINDSRTMIVVSPKKGFANFAVRNYVNNDKVHFKVVVGAPEGDETFWGFEEGVRFIKELFERYNHKRENIWVMPFGASTDILIKNRQKVWVFAIENGVNYSPRLHVEVFGTALPGI